MVRLRDLRLPRRNHKAARYTKELAEDVVDVVLRRRPPMVPPRRVRWYTGAGFDVGREEWARLCIDELGVRPGDRVLDVGCGVGRLAMALVDHLGPSGSYEGFDVVGRGIVWARRHITRRYPNFRFQVVDVRNARYNDRSGDAASAFRFPYPDGSFDAVLVSSVFTHMRGAEVEHYLAEIARVLAPRGRALLTAFLVDDDLRRGLADGTTRPKLPFRQTADGLVTTDPVVPEAAIGHDREWMLTRVAAAGLRLARPIRDGSWRTRDGGFPGQDVLIVEPSSPA